MKEQDSHRDTDNDVRRVPKAHIASIASGRGRIPRHDDEEQIGRDVEYDRYIPCAEFGPREPQLATTVPDDVQAYGREAIEDRSRVRL